MKHLNIVVAAVLSLSAVSAAHGQATGGSYIAPSVGVNFFDDEESGGLEIEFDSGLSIGFMGGSNLQDSPLRFEAGVEYHQADLKASYRNSSDVNLSVSAVISRINGWIDIPVLGEDIIPYVGDGLGLANLEISAQVQGFTISDSGYYFTWQVGTGVGVSITDNLVLDVGYRYGVIDEDLSFGRVDIAARYMY